jgi:hypothetical protein
MSIYRKIKKLYQSILKFIKIESQMIPSAINIKSSQNIIILLDDDKAVVQSFQENFGAYDINAELICCANYEEYVKAMEISKNDVKCLIMDLSNNSKEDVSHEFNSVNYIMKEYETNRIPIFIHSASVNLRHFEKLEDNGTIIKEKGTIIKKPKTNKAVSEICEFILLMQKSGFLNIFSFGGTLEHKIMREIHNAFVNQFKPNEIEEIIKSIQKSSPDNLEKRTQEVFERIALRSVYQNVISNIGSDESIGVNSIEHYYRRLDGKPLWTGDIFEREEDKTLFFVATPRCDLDNAKLKNLLVCKIIDVKQDEEINPTGNVRKAEDRLRKFITDNRTEERYRFLPRTPQFRGGVVDFVEIEAPTPKDFLDKSKYRISLVDDLTNDVVRKLAAYLLRGGISDTAYSEALYYFQQQEEKEVGKET